MFDNLKTMATDAVGSVLAATTLDEKAIEMLTKTVGEEKMAEFKAMIADGNISPDEITKMAASIGIPENMVSMVVGFFKKGTDVVETVVTEEETV